MLSLGREILAEPNTSSASDTLMQKLTGFIQDWSDLQLNWQNWFDELHAGVEQSKSLSDQLKKFENNTRGLGPACAKLFPAFVNMKNLDKELKRLQVSATHPGFSRERVALLIPHQRNICIFVVIFSNHIKGNSLPSFSLVFHLPIKL
jgi:hypothetical protein